LSVLTIPASHYNEQHGKEDGYAVPYNTRQLDELLQIVHSLTIQWFRQWQQSIKSTSLKSASICFFASKQDTWDWW